MPSMSRNRIKESIFVCCQEGNEGQSLVGIQETDGILESCTDPAICVVDHRVPAGVAAINRKSGARHHLL